MVQGQPTLRDAGSAPILEVMTISAHSLPTGVAESLAQIREIYYEHFDRTWFTSALRDFPMDHRQIQDIRHALALGAPTVWDLPVIHRGASALKIYVRLIRQTVLPKASALFGLSSYDAPGFKSTSDSRLQRRLVAYTLPLNLERLSSALKALEEVLPPVPDAMPSIRTSLPFRNSPGYVV